jgi:FixJ family two-component response regulator
MKEMAATKVLVIDDEQVVLDSVRRILEAENMTVDGALSAKEGMAAALGTPYDIVLSDIRMPEVGGMKVLRDIKRAKPSLPVVLITGFATVSSAVQAMKLGAADYIEKPFTPDALAAAVRRALESSRKTAPEDQGILHRDEVVRVLERAAADGQFVADLFYLGADALEGYELTAAEKLAILTGDVPWIERHLGTLSATQKRWLEQRLSAEIW